MTKIRLDARQKSSLNWETSILQAELAMEKGKKILWELDFGLFNGLLHPLSHSQQFLSLCLAIEHFRNRIWETYQDSTLGVSFYSGKLNLQDISKLIDKKVLQNWIHERFDSLEEFHYETNIALSQFDSVELETLQNQLSAKFMLSIFSRDIAVDYIKQLAGQLPYGLDAHVELTLNDNFSPIERLIYQNEECYKPLIHLEEVVDTTANIGICLPPIHKFSMRWNHLFDQALSKLIERQICFRPIPEESLITNLEGLDELIVCPSAMSYQGRRQLQGFCAAGGKVLTLEKKSLGLPQEFQFDDYYRNRT